MKFTTVSRLTASVLMMTFLLVNTVAGQADVDGLIGRGTATSEGAADRVRMTVTIKAKGPTMEAAVKSLAERRKKAMIKMEKMSVVEDSIEFGELTVSGQNDGRQQQVMSMMMAQAQGDERLKRMMKVKPPSTVQVDVTADWNIDSSLDDTELFIAVDKLKNKIIEADIAGTKIEDELSPEQEELAEEMAEQSNRYGSDGSNSVAPKFFYVRKISADDAGKLMQEAATKAKANALQLAESTGVTLGNVFRVASMDAENVREMFYGPYGYQNRGAQPQTMTDDDGSVHAISPTLNVTYSKSVVFAFKISQ